jgi:hypothetical protein
MHHRNYENLYYCNYENLYSKICKLQSISGFPKRYGYIPINHH